MPEPSIDAVSINRLIHRTIRQHFTRTVALMEEIHIYRGQPPLLYELWEHEGSTQSELAERLHLSPATVTRMVQRMELSGLLERRPDPADQRVLRVYLTPAGREIRAAVESRDRQVGEEALSGFSPEERAQLAEFLERIRSNLLSVNTSTRLPTGTTSQSQSKA